MHCCQDCPTQGNWHHDCVRNRKFFWGCAWDRHLSSLQEYASGSSLNHFSLEQFYCQMFLIAMWAPSWIFFRLKRLASQAYSHTCYLESNRPDLVTDFEWRVGMLILEVTLFPLVLTTPNRLVGSGWQQCPYKKVLMEQLSFLQKPAFQTHSAS